MVEPKIIKEWLDKADEDYEFALVNLKEKNSFYSKICFHFHEAAEKYLKAYIVAHELKFEKTHDLIELIDICKNNEPSFEELREGCDFLNRFYIETRYPVHWPTNYSIGVTKKAQKECEHIGNFVKEHLKKDERG